MATIIIIVSIFFLHTRKTSFLSAGKKRTELKPSFSVDVFPKNAYLQIFAIIMCKKGVLFGCNCAGDVVRTSNLPYRQKKDPDLLANAARAFAQHLLPWMVDC